MKSYIFGKTSNQEEKLVYEEPANSAQIRFLDERIKRNDKRLTKADACVGDLDELININFLYPVEQICELEGMLRSKYDKQVSIKVIKDIYNEGFYTLEVSNKDANKGKMLEYVSNLLNVNMQDITVFGDQANDKEMFDLAGTKIAVGNANEMLKAMADKVVESNDCDGVVKYLRDVWVGSGERKIDAIMCIVDLLKRDSEIKILIGCTEEEKAIVYETHNESEFMKGILIIR